MGILVAYVVFVCYLIWMVRTRSEDGWLEVVKSFSPLFFDLLIVFLFSAAFLIVRGYFLEENSRVAKAEVPDESFFLVLDVESVTVILDPSHLFERHKAVASILDALPIDQGDFFLAHAGSLDIPKLTLRSVDRSTDGDMTLRLGIASFKEFFYTHHFPDFSLSRSSSTDRGGKVTLRSLFSPVYQRAYSEFFESFTENKGAIALELLEYAPNTMGVTGCVRLVGPRDSLLFLQRRGFHESAARGYVQLSYAGTLDAYPDYVGKPGGRLSIAELAEGEFCDEFAESEVGRMMHLPDCEVEHRLVGLCVNSQYLFQPELFIQTTIRTVDPALVAKLAHRFDVAVGHSFIAVRSFAEIEELDRAGQIRLRPLCRAALHRVFAPRSPSP